MGVNDRRKIGIARGGEKDVLALVLWGTEWGHTGTDDPIDSVVTAVKRHHVLLIQIWTPKEVANMHRHGLIGCVLATRPRIHDSS